MSSAPGAVGTRARQQIADWRAKLESQVDVLADISARDSVRALWSPDDDVIETHPVVPEKVSAGTGRLVKDSAGEPTIEDLPLVEQHLFADVGTGKFPIKYGSTWEKKVLDVELARGDATGLIGWYRNPGSGQHALSVRYDTGDADDAPTGLLHPDFLFFRRVTDRDGLRVDVDIVDPHLHSGADAGPKWRGLAAYAALDTARDVPRLGVVRAVSENASKVIRFIDLRDSAVVRDLEGVATKDDVDALFSKHGKDL